MALTQISTAGVKDDAVTAGKIPANAVGSSEIAANAVGSSELADNAVDTAAIANNAVNSDKIATNAVNTTEIADTAVTLAKLEHGTSSNDGKFLRANNGADPTFETVNTDLVSDTSPQLGGNLDVNTKNIVFGDSAGATDDRLTFGASTDLSIYHDGGHSTILDNGTGNLKIYTNGAGVEIQKSNGENLAKFITDGAVELYHDNGLRLATESSQVTVHRPSSFPNPNNTGSEITGATLDIGGNLHLEERYPNGAYADRQDLVLKTNTGYGQGLNDKVRFSSSGSIFLEVAGSGISFEPHGASNVNLLDDYEEGQFTPIIQGTGSNNSKVYVTQLGEYTKIGHMVWVRFRVAWSSRTTDSGSAVIYGLPYNCNDAVAVGGALAYKTITFGGTSTSKPKDQTFETIESQNGLLILTSEDGENFGNVAASIVWTSSGEVRGSAFYTTNS